MPRRLSDVWQHYKLINEEGGRIHSSCRYCNKEFQSSNSTRLTVHMVQCEVCPENIKTFFREQLPKDVAAKILSPKYKHFVHRKGVRDEIKHRFMIWKHFQSIGAGERKQALCIYCNIELSKNSICQLLNHIRNCEACPVDVKNEYKGEEFERYLPNNTYDPRLSIKRSKVRPKVWNHFSLLDKQGNKKHVTCNYCSVEYTHSNATRLVVHLCRCPHCPDEVKQKFLVSLKSNGKPDAPLPPKKFSNIPTLSPATSRKSKTGKPPSDVWQYFSIISEVGYKKHGSCKFCKKEYRHSNATRLLKHIIVECEQCPDEVKQKYITEEFVSNDRDEEGMPQSPEAPPKPSAAMSSFVKIENNFDNDETGFDPLEVPVTNLDSGPMNIKVEPDIYPDIGIDTDIVDKALARAALYSGLPYNIFESKHWKNAFNILRPKYRPPSAYEIEHRFLDEERLKINLDMEKDISCTDTITLSYDTSETEIGTLVHFIVMTPKPWCYQIVYKKVQGTERSSFICEELSKVITNIGFRKLVILMSREKNNTNIEVIRSKIPNTIAIQCLYEQLVNFFEDVEREMISSSYDIKVIVNYLKTDILNRLEDPKDEIYRRIINTLQPVDPKDWENYLKYFKYFFDCKEYIMSLAARFKSELVINNDKFWELGERDISIITPIFEALVRSQSIKGLISDVPAILYKLHTELEKELSRFSQDDHLILRYLDRLKKSCITPIHLAANLLDPRYIGSTLTHEETSEAMSFISKYAIANSDDPGLVMMNLAEFKTKTGYFGKVEAIWNSVQMLEPQIWWKSFCAHLNLMPIAVRLLNVPCSRPDYETKLKEGNLEWNTQQDKDRMINLEVMRLNIFLQNRFHGDTE
ncbi:unnamed protein product [Leptosia nina]|uniref:BED-type domain-containing protein n=1 Tax=Leptosia nina TaxID=320188 RepID=A0AAV1J9X8_9NEOP